MSKITVGQRLNCSDYLGMAVTFLQNQKQLTRTLFLGAVEPKAVGPTEGGYCDAPVPVVATMLMIRCTRTTRT
jgi:hypothetical protein